MLEVQLCGTHLCCALLCSCWCASENRILAWERQQKVTVGHVSEIRARKAVLAEMGRCAEEAGLDDALRAKLVGGYLILRFINPAILAPDGHGLRGSPPTAAPRPLRYGATLP